MGRFRREFLLLGEKGDEACLLAAEMLALGDDVDYILGKCKYLIIGMLRQVLRFRRTTNKRSLETSRKTVCTCIRSEDQRSIV